LNGATCQAIGDGSSYIWICPSGFTGNNCTTKITTTISTTTIATMTPKPSTTSPLKWSDFDCTAECVTGKITPIPGTSPSWNGCGKEEGYDFSKLLSKNFLNGFTRCCNDRDICYDTCSTVHLRTNLDRIKMEHRWKQHKKRKAHKKISFKNVTLYNLIR
jgi:hypothetical protein